MPSPRKDDVVDIGDKAAGGRRLWRDIRSAPNLISLSRIALIYGSAILFVYDQIFGALILGTIAGLTDFADGWLARKTGQVSDIGAILDRLSDLVFETTWLVLVTWRNVLPAIVLVLYLLREFVILSARLYCSERGVALPSSLLGKMKSNFFGYAAFFIYLSLSDMVPSSWSHAIMICGESVVGAALLLSYLSAGVYLKTFVEAYGKPKV
jgi:CDP-diacylglycerol--glycerol-3-phosphate 3-phosphatidyltransferase